MGGALVAGTLLSGEVGLLLGLVSRSISMFDTAYSLGAAKGYLTVRVAAEPAMKFSPICGGALMSRRVKTVTPGNLLDNRAEFGS